MRPPYLHSHLLVAALGVVTLGCGSDSTTGPEPLPAGTNFAISTVGGVFPTQTTYIQGFNAVPTGTINNQNAFELAKSGSLWTYDGAAYVYSFGAPATMTRYTFDATGRATAGPSLIVPGANTFSTLQFLSPTEAYGSLAGGLAKLLRFNPTTMAQIDEIDLSSLNRPEANSLWYIGSYVRDGKLFLAVDYQRNFNAVFDSAFVAVIDLATRKIEKLISDGRTAMIYAAGQGVNAFAEDANGDIYVQARGNKDSGGRKGSGVLRIKKGATNFDPTYFFDLDAALGGPAYGLWVFPPENVAFTFRAIDPNDMWDFNGPNFRLYRVDLAQRTSLGPVAGVPDTKGSSTQHMRRFEPGKIHFAVAGRSEDAVYVYTAATGQATKVFTSSAGQISGFDKLRK